MKLITPAPVEGFTRNIYRWFRDTHLRSLDRALKAAIAIQDLETEYFDGKKIDANATHQLEGNTTTTAYLQTKLHQLLRKMQWSLAEFRMASAIAPNPEDQTSQKAKQILNKLAVVDRVLARYKDSEISLLDSILDSHHHEESLVVSKSLDLDRDEKLAASTIPEPEILTNKPVPLLRSIFPSFTKYNRERRSNTEADVIKEFQLSRYRTKRALKFLAILIIIPLITQQVAKNFIFSPIFSHFQAVNLLEISLNSQLEREAIEEVEAFEKKIKFEINIGKTPDLSSEDVEKMVHQKSIEVARKSEHEGSNALQNIFADILSAIAFAWILIAGKRSVEILKDFLDEKIYGLSESAKAFLIILFTDVFVGFHSSHGWEVVMEGLLRHLGIPENRDFIYLFIATFPVVLDSIFKYWIFCYLSRVSPSAVATYRNMNE
ncbi:MAG: hypothetical protein LW723_17140 [Pseudanabaena sp. 42896M_M3]|nr:hypothetical protein [Pseudanabaena sp. 42896M_M3]